MYKPGQLRGSKGGLFARLGRAPTRALAQQLRPPEPRAAEMIYLSWVRSFWRLWGHTVLAELEQPGATPEFARLFSGLLAGAPPDSAIKRAGISVTDLVSRYLRSIFKPGQLPRSVRVDAGFEELPRLRPYQNAGQEQLIDEWRIENLRLIRGASAEHVAELAEVFKEAQEQGIPHAELIERIKDVLGAGENRAKLIASDQTTKFNGSIQAIQQQAAGITEFVWSTSHDGAVRPSHRLLDGRTFSWATGAPDGAEHVLPGQPVRCRCQPVPVIPLFEGLE